ncbi:MAG: hypothetical protein QOE58_423, partial [Actinomycetota bacterium]|nr:hypothetical protein [Actinomycetota bacterium]
EQVLRDQGLNPDLEGLTDALTLRLADTFGAVKTRGMISAVLTTAIAPPRP